MSNVVPFYYILGGGEYITIVVDEREHTNAINAPESRALVERSLTDGCLIRGMLVSLVSSHIATPVQKAGHPSPWLRIRAPI